MSTSFKNSRATLVATFRLKGGLNQVTGFFLFFLYFGACFFGLYFNFYLYPHLSSSV